MHLDTFCILLLIALCISVAFNIVLVQHKDKSVNELLDEVEQKIKDKTHFDEIKDKLEKIKEILKS